MSQANTFATLLARIETAHNELAAQASRAVNTSLTLRNWLIGAYIAEYELHGKDRADYGKQLLPRLAQRLRQAGIAACGKRQLYGYLRFQQAYPQIVRSLPATWLPPTLAPPDAPAIVRSPTALSDDTATPLIAALSYTHFEQLVAIEDPTQRDFYQAQCLQGQWSVRELKRQIASLHFERSALSHDPAQLAAQTRRSTQLQASLNIRDPYVFEFLGLTPAEVMSESQLEQQLTDKLQAFLLELGHGFCFEARQKRLVIGGEHYFVDLVFYHRILKCHVLVELKLAAFTHENLGQLNTYVNWYRQHMMSEGDQPPVGILLCTGKNHALVEYALAGMDNQLFVSRYQLALPQKEAMQKFIEEKLREAGERE